MISKSRTCTAWPDACAHVEHLQSRNVEGAVIDTVRFPADQRKQAGSSSPRSIYYSGVAVCYSGLLRGFGGPLSGALDNHARHFLAPLSQTFKDGLFVAFSTAWDAAKGKEEDATLPPKVWSSLLKHADVPPTRIIEARRPLVNATSNYMAKLAFLGIEHCGRLIETIRTDRRGGRPFEFAVRMRYDTLLAPAVMPGIHAWMRPTPPAASTAAPAAPAMAAKLPSAPLLTLAKYVFANSTPTRGMHLLDPPCPWQLPARRCVPQDVFVVVRHMPSTLGLVERFFLAQHDQVRYFRTPGLGTRMHAPERTLLDPVLSRGLPVDVLWLDGHGRCGWMLVDDRRLKEDTRAPRAIFRNRCAELRRAAAAGAASERSRDR